MGRQFLLGVDHYCLQIKYSPATVATLASVKGSLGCGTDGEPPLSSPWLLSS